MTDHAYRERKAPTARGNVLRALRKPWPRLLRHGAIVGVGLIGLAATAAFPPRPWLIWNSSASAPIGLYVLEPGSHPQIGDMVLARVPERWRHLGAQRRYIPINVPLVKQVAAQPGENVCAIGREIFVNGRRVAERKALDAMGRPMPWWNGCAMLRGGAMFLLMDNPSSFDGRYFGPTRREDIIGRVRLLWRP